MRKEQRKYFKQLKRALNCEKSTRNLFIEDTRHMIDKIFRENPNASYEDIKSLLGNPDDLAAVFMENVDKDEQKRYTKRKKFIRNSCIAVLLLIFASCVIFTIYASNQRRNAEITKETTIIIYE